jgi:hypothetical protein
MVIRRIVRRISIAAASLTHTMQRKRIVVFLRSRALSDEATRSRVGLGPPGSPVGWQPGRRQVATPVVDQ